MSQVNKGRRAFTAALGGLVAFPGLIGLACRAAPQTETVLSPTLAAALPLTGDTMGDAQIERTNRAFEMLLGDLETLRQFAVPPGVEPAPVFKAR